MINTVTKEYHEKNFIGYQVVYENNEKWFVPLDEANTDYQAIMEFIADGGTVIDNPPE
jgi:hypothetical protein|tara:strand:- start:19 stop:192 length:174 start_codon:yes stop_codon:yes gene_type:complete